MLQKFLLIILIPVLAGYSEWETLGGNSQRTGFVNAVGPESPNDILWEGGSLLSDGGRTILISNNKLVTIRSDDPNLEYAPLVCHDLYTGDTLWTRDFPGGDHSMSVPLGFRNNVIYAANWLGNLQQGDTLYAIDAFNGNTIWRSSVGIIGSPNYVGVAFTKNGDLILPLPHKVARINHINGDTLWTVYRDVFVSPDYCGLSTFQETAYGWELGPSNEVAIVAIDLETGVKKYWIEIPTTGSPLNYATGPLPVIDDNGIIYVHRSNDNLVALKDDGESLSIIWNIPIRDGGTTKPAVGPDNSIYFTIHNRIMHANTINGEIIDSSIIVWVHETQHIRGHIAIDANGTVFYNTEFTAGALFSFTKDLKLNWIDSIDVLAAGGPALHSSGLLAIAGKGDLVRVYRPVNLNIDKHIDYSIHPQITTSSSSQFLTFTCHLTNNTPVKLLFYNTRGQCVYRHESRPSVPGLHIIKLNNFGSGQYIYRLNIGEKTITSTVSITK